MWYGWKHLCLAPLGAFVIAGNKVRVEALVLGATWGNTDSILRTERRTEKERQAEREWQ